jgi:hypothetical protein
MPGQAAREKEIQYRLLNVIDILEEEHLDCPPLPDEAAEQWTEAEIRAFFRSGGDARPGPVPPTVIQGLPGGTSYDHVGNDRYLLFIGLSPLLPATVDPGPDPHVYLSG